jgi:hypothetical protein
MRSDQRNRSSLDGPPVTRYSQVLEAAHQRLIKWYFSVVILDLNFSIKNFLKNQVGIFDLFGPPLWIA